MSDLHARDGLPPISQIAGGGGTTTLPPPEWLPERIGQYKVVEVLGRGGMGVVYRAEQEQPRRQVALKVIRPGAVSADNLRRFEHEVRVLGTLEHPGIARIYEAGTTGAAEGGQPFFAMELVQGRPLIAYADKHRLGVRQRLGLMVKVCETVQYAHQKGVIHRDLKPENVLVDERGQPKVVDFGVARVTDGDLRATHPGTDTGQLVGTLPYMSPEQVQGDPRSLDTRSDVYALGVLCYELLSGRLPYDLHGKAVLEAARAIAEEEPAPLSSVNKLVDRDLAAVVAKALEKDKARRYQSAEALAADLVRHLEGKPVEARAAGALSKSWKYARRHKVVAGSLLVVVLVLLAATGVSIRWAMAARGAERQARDRLAESYEQAAHLALQRGAWGEALSWTDKALATERYRESVPLWLNKVRALVALNDFARAGEELEALAAAPNLGEHEGTVLLLRGDVLLGRDDAKAEQLLRRALGKTLPPAEAAYARALLAKTTPEAVELLRQTLALDPYQPRARAAREVLLILLGRLPEARDELNAHQALFPADVNATVLRAVLAGLEGRRDEAGRILAGLRGSWADGDLPALGALVELLAEFRNPDHFGPDTGLPNLGGHGDLAARAVGIPGVGRLRPGDGWDKLLAAFSGVVPRFPLPPLLRKSFVRGLTGLVGVAIDGAGRVRGTGPEELTRAVQAHPEGTLLYFRAKVLLAAHRFEEASRAAREAAAAPALLPVRQPALLDAAVSDAMGYVADKDPARRRRIVEDLRGLLAEDLKGVSPYQRGMAVHLAFSVKEYNLARVLLDNWRRVAPNDPAIGYYRVKIEFLAEAYGAAVEAAEEFLRQKPADTEKFRRFRAEAGKLKKQAEAKLREQARRLGPAAPGK
jgi:predicted Ser/Thr protein kinase/tetratricopeptide (TPR) repeat protein